jgi:hypothetical protein
MSALSQRVEIVLPTQGFKFRNIESIATALAVDAKTARIAVAEAGARPSLVDGGVELWIIPANAKAGASAPVRDLFSHRKYKFRKIETVALNLGLTVPLARVKLATEGARPSKRNGGKELWTRQVVA